MSKLREAEVVFGFYDSPPVFRKILINLEEVCSVVESDTISDTNGNWICDTVEMNIKGIAYQVRWSYNVWKQIMEEK